MSKKSKRHPAAIPSPSVAAEPAFLVRLLGGRPRPSEVIALLAIVLVIGASAGYLVYRFASPSQIPGALPADEATPWQARLAQSPNDIVALLGLAHVRLDQQQLDEAERLYRQVLAAEPENVEAITHLGAVLLARGQADEALRRYDEALALAPTYVHALWDKGNLLQQVKRDYPAAVRTWEAFIQAVGADSQDGKTAQQFIAEAKQAMAKGR